MSQAVVFMQVRLRDHWSPISGRTEGPGTQSVVICLGFRYHIDTSLNSTLVASPLTGEAMICVLQEQIDHVRDWWGFSCGATLLHEKYLDLDLGAVGVLFIGRFQCFEIIFLWLGVCWFYNSLHINEFNDGFICRKLRDEIARSVQLRSSQEEYGHASLRVMTASP